MARKKADTNEILEPTNLNRFSLKRITPLTDNQKIAYDAYLQDFKNLLLYGSAGTGKSFLGLFLALKDVITGDSPYKKVIIVRSAVQTREQGYLPGNLAEKEAAYELPYIHLVSELFNRKDAYTVLKNKHVIEFTSTSFLRGLTFDNCIVVVDECQNLNHHENSTIITRLGENAKIIFCGDYKQTDLNKKNDQSGMNDLVEILSNMPDYFECVEFDVNDVVRSGLVKEYLIESEKYYRDK